MAKKKHSSKKPSTNQPQTESSNDNNLKENHLKKASSAENMEVAKQLYALGVLYSQDNLFEKSIEIFKKIEKFFEQDPEFYVYLGKDYYELFEYKHAFEYLSKATGLGSKDPNVFNILGSIYLSDNCNEDAFKAFNHSIQLNPQNPIAYYYRGHVNVRLDKTASAIEDFKTATILNRDKLEYHITLLEFELKNRKLSEVIADGLESVKYHNDESLYFMLAIAYIGLHHFDMGLLYLKKCFQQHPKNENFYRILDDIYSQLQFTIKYEAEEKVLSITYSKEWIIYHTYLQKYADEILFPLTEISHSSFIITLYACKVGYLQQQFLSLLNDKITSPTLEEKASDIFYQLAVAYSNCGNFCLEYCKNNPKESPKVISPAYFEKAIEFFNKAMVMGKSVHFELGLANLSLYESQIPNIKKEPLEKAIKYLEAAVNMEENSCFQSARDNFAKGEVTKALLEICKFLKFEIADKKAIPGQIYFTQKCYAEAIEEFTLVLSIDFITSKPEYYLLRGLAYLELNNFAAANYDLQAALDLDKGKTLIYLNQYKKIAPHLNFQHPEIKNLLIRGFPDPDQESPPIPTLCHKEGDIDNKSGKSESNKIYFPDEYSFWNWEDPNEPEPQQKIQEETKKETKEEKEEENNFYRFP